MSIFYSFVKRRNYSRSARRAGGCEAIRRVFEVDFAVFFRHFAGAAAVVVVVAAKRIVSGQPLRLGG
ncbi:hypothetical protein [Paraburkholderia ribeironis]|uniref:hypothetical protein n=1 Tax=Paraburkholderia ribeironis TaxID=1247936 RepID=UPI000B9D504B|nr:hypothetical protein [Paraburkholderia ribeironis]